MTPDIDRTPDATIHGDQVSYVGEDGDTYAVDIRQVYTAAAAWEELAKVWDKGHRPAVNARFDALANRLEAAGWRSQGVGSGRSDYLPPDYWEARDQGKEPPEDGPMFCVPFRPYPGWEDDMTDLEVNVDAWIAARAVAQ